MAPITQKQIEFLMNYSEHEEEDVKKLSKVAAHKLIGQIVATWQLKKKPTNGDE